MGTLTNRVLIKEHPSLLRPLSEEDVLVGGGQ